MEQGFGIDCWMESSVLSSSSALIGLLPNRKLFHSFQFGLNRYHRHHQHHTEGSGIQWNSSTICWGKWGKLCHMILVAWTERWPSPSLTSCTLTSARLSPSSSWQATTCSPNDTNDTRVISTNSLEHKLRWAASAVQNVWRCQLVRDDDDKRPPSMECCCWWKAAKSCFVGEHGRGQRVVRAH